MKMPREISSNGAKEIFLEDRAALAELASQTAITIPATNASKDPTLFTIARLFLAIAMKVRHASFG
jgi:hypothetical protein